MGDQIRTKNSMDYLGGKSALEIERLTKMLAGKMFMFFRKNVKILNRLVN
jgi:hypothetical protein